LFERDLELRKKVLLKISTSTFFVKGNFDGFIKRKLSFIPFMSIISVIMRGRVSNKFTDSGT